MSNWSTIWRPSGLTIEDAEELIEEMYHANVISLGRDSVPDRRQPLPTFFPSRRW
jgi:hypothetical protein